MPECYADATWNGNVTDGSGEVAFGTGVWRGTYATPEVPSATNPEELLAAAHASCFAMTAAYVLEMKGYDVDSLTADAAVTLEQTADGFDIPGIELTVAGTVPDASEEAFTAIVDEAAAICPISAALAGTDIRVSTVRLFG